MAVSLSLLMVPSWRRVINFHPTIWPGAELPLDLKERVLQNKLCLLVIGDASHVSSIDFHYSIPRSAHGWADGHWETTTSATHPSQLE